MHLSLTTTIKSTKITPIICGVFFLFSFFFICTSTDAQIKKNEKQSRTVKNNIIDGVYEPISLEIILTRPEKESTRITSPELKGIWQLSKGYFTSILMRDNSYLKKDKMELTLNGEETVFAFESFGGTYTITNNKIIFIQNYSMNPMFKNRPVVVKFTVKGNNLVLRQTLTPTVEDLREGTIITTLKKVG